MILGKCGLIARSFKRKAFAISLGKDFPAIENIKIHRMVPFAGHGDKVPGKSDPKKPEAQFFSDANRQNRKRNRNTHPAINHEIQIAVLWVVIIILIACKP